MLVRIFQTNLNGNLFSVDVLFYTKQLGLVDITIIIIVNYVAIARTQVMI
jgi:hypothetical protein